MIDPILITGCARSGTSMVAGIINMCGAYGGNMSGPTQNNRKGMFENAHIRNNIVKPYLRKLEVDPLGQYPLPDVDKLIIQPNWKKEINSTLQREGYKEGAWMYKGAKMCLFWPQWQYAYPDAKWLIIRRKTSDIINSCIKTGFMRAFSLPKNLEAINEKTEQKGWLWWVHQHEQRFIEMMDNETGVLHWKEIWPERFIEGDFTQIKETIEWLGLEWNDEVYDFVDQKLWKQKKKAR